MKVIEGGGVLNPSECFELVKSKDVSRQHNNNLSLTICSG